MNNVTRALMAILDFFMPQLRLNREHRALDGRWRWIRRQPTTEQEQALFPHPNAPVLFEYAARWFILYGATLVAAVQVGPPLGALLYILSAILVIWTLGGIIRVRQRVRDRDGGVEA